ncbi:uroporphyrinogen-III synthase [uncultured Marinobacter sp.]|uniref:uroporphyrinogen-III synthase n=1 Tax=uncultured Marinobacter sp. TaxID=187379 RepID=UPI000C0A44AC|nr:uroporphyrinogen III synthase [Marinobacter sp.]MBI44112.1 uroporphyrinogen III synthase [Oceanospirillales bacterium]
MATPRADRPALACRRILICRPEPEASRLARAFEIQGADVRCLPLLVREPLPETPEQRTLLLDLDRFSHVIVVSPYAAQRLLEALNTWWPQLPVGIRWYAVGAGTARVLTRQGLSVRRPAAGWTSEQLLALPSLQRIDGDRVLLARGQEGRELIRETLSARGAQVTTLPLYRRRCPDYPADVLAQRLGHFDPDAVVTLSGETLNNLIALCAKSGHNLYDKLLVVPAERVARAARDAGFRHTCVPAGLADPDIVSAVADCLQRGPDGAGTDK